MNPAPLVREWLAKAKEDLGLAEHLLREGTPYVTAAAFHAQQAAEKYLKALLVRHQIEFPRTHDIELLLDLVETVDASAARALRPAGALTPYGAVTRYPGGLSPLGLEDLRRAVELASMVGSRVRQILGIDRAPPPA